MNPTPSIIRETSNGCALISVYDDMLARREISISGEIEPSMAHDVCQHLRYLEQQDPQTEATVFVESPGGDVRAGLAIYDTMRRISCPVRTVCLGFAASMGAIVFMGGDEREMAPHATIMIHDPLIPSGAGGSARAVQETSRRLMETRRVLNGILAERAGLPLKRIQNLTGKDTYLDAERALDLGFAHTIIPSRKEN